MSLAAKVRASALTGILFAFASSFAGAHGDFGGAHFRHMGTFGHGHLSRFGVPMSMFRHSPHFSGGHFGPGGFGCGPALGHPFPHRPHRRIIIVAPVVVRNYYPIASYYYYPPLYDRSHNDPAPHNASAMYGSQSAPAYSAPTPQYSLPPEVKPPQEDGNVAAQEDNPPPAAPPSAAPPARSTSPATHGAQIPPAGAGRQSTPIYRCAASHIFTNFKHREPSRSGWRKVSL